MYYIVYYTLYLVSLLPWFIIYRLSDFFYYILYHLVGYRKEVVMNNLLTAFPEKTEQERIAIAKDMYQQLFDTFLETIKLLSITKEELNKRFKCNYELLDDLYATGKNVQLHGGHFFNWEYLNLAYAANLVYPFVGVYQPLTSPIFGKIMYNMRSRFGTGMVSVANFNREFFKYSKGRYALALGGDQNSSNLENAYWISFFGRMAPFVTGLERMAVAKDTAIVFATTYRIKRGYYQSEFSLYTTEPKTLPKGAITIAYRDFLEGQIRLRPSNYLWTHKRWKHKYDAEKFKEMTLS